MTRTPRRTALLVAVALAVPGLAACGGATAARPGAAATVGGSNISATDLADRVTRSLQDPQAKQQFADKAEFQRRTLTLMIDHNLIDAAAKDVGVTVSDAEVDAKMKEFVAQAGSQAALEKQAAAAGVAKQDLRPYIRDVALTEKIGDKLIANKPVSAAALQKAYEQQFVKVHAAHILVKDKKLADKLLAQVKANPSSFAALAKKYSTDPGSKAKGGDLGTQAPSSYVAPFAQAITNAKVGSFVEAHTSFGYHVIHVISRAATKTLAQATPELRRQLLQNVRQQEVGKLLQRVSKEQKVDVNPRFGAWDAVKGEVTAPADKLSSPAPSSSTG